MKKLGKTFLTMITLVCMFSYMGVVKAETSKLSSVENGSIAAVSNLLTGKELSNSDKDTITALEGKYKLYFQYKSIDADTYNKYKSGDSSAGTTIANLISDPQSVEELSSADGPWNAVEGTQISYSDLEYDAQNPTGYVVALMATKDSNIYTYKNVYQATSATTLATYASVAKTTEVTDETVEKNEATEEEADVGGEEEDTEESTDSEEVEKSETNPKTGISDVAIYLAPAAIILGSTLYLRRRNA